MYANLNYGIHNGKWVNPLAAYYRTPITQHLEELAQVYPSVSGWLRSDRISYFDRSVTFIVPAGGSTIRSIDIGAGYDCLVFSRTACAVTTDPGAGGRERTDILPSELASRVDVTIARKSSQVDTEESPVQNTFGFGYEPFVRAAQVEYWAGKSPRDVTINNNSRFEMRVTLTFTIALL